MRSHNECAFEDDLVDALRTGRWPAAAGTVLQAHVGHCQICGDLVEVAGALLEARDPETAPLAMPGADVVWCRARVRTRQDAARAAARPILLAQGISLGCAVGLATAALGAGWPWLAAWAAWFWGQVSAPDAGVIGAALLAEGLPRLAVMGFAGFVVGVVLPVILLVTLSDEA